MAGATALDSDLTGSGLLRSTCRGVVLLGLGVAMGYLATKGWYEAPL